VFLAVGPSDGRLSVAKNVLAVMAADELAPAYLVQLWAAVAVLRRPVLRVHDPSRTAGNDYVKPTGER
jgi:hypothetical protein